MPLLYVIAWNAWPSSQWQHHLITQGRVFNRQVGNPRSEQVSYMGNEEGFFANFRCLERPLSRMLPGRDTEYRDG